jgi:hypothetical protein
MPDCGPGIGKLQWPIWVALFPYSHEAQTLTTVCIGCGHTLWNTKLAGTSAEEEMVSPAHLHKSECKEGSETRPEVRLMGGQPGYALRQTVLAGSHAFFIYAVCSRRCKGGAAVSPSVTMGAGRAPRYTTIVPMQRAFGP